MVAVIIALGVNLLSTYLASNDSIRPFIGWIGVTLVVGALLWMIQLTFRERSVSVEYQAVFLFDSEKSCLVAMPDYDFSEALNRTLSAVFAESKGLEQVWRKEPLIDHKPLPDWMKDPKSISSTFDHPVKFQMTYQVLEGHRRTQRPFLIGAASDLSGKPLST
jgi:hypothetical protein